MMLSTLAATMIIAMANGELSTCAPGQCDGCNWACYLNNYGDLRAEYGYDLAKAEHHYVTYILSGDFEARDCTCRTCQESTDQGVFDCSRYGEMLLNEANAAALCGPPAFCTKDLCCKANAANCPNGVCSGIAATQDGQESDWTGKFGRRLSQ